MQVVIIGGPSTGKTTIIQELDKRGILTVPEVSRRLLIEAKIPSPREDRHAFQKEQLRQQFLAENDTFNKNTLACLDGGIFDGPAYYQMDKLPVPDVYDTIDGSRYKLALLFEEIGIFEEDGVRYQNVEYTRLITPLLRESYSRREVEVVDVKAMPISARIDFVLEQILRLQEERTVYSST